MTGLPSGGWMKRDGIAVGMLLAVIAAFANEVWRLGASPFGGDIAVQFHPWKVFARGMLAAGEIPYWNPYTHAGAPFLANVQSAVFYPFDLILFLLPMEYFFGLSLLLHLWIAGLGCYALARICGASAFPALFAGLAYGLNGFTMIHIPFGNHLTYAGAAWAPWLFFVTAGYVLRPGQRLAWSAAGALVVWLHFMCGHPQMLFYSLVFDVLLVGGLLAWLGRREEGLERSHLTALGLGWMGVLLLGMLMGAFQLIATLEYLAFANRAGGLDLEAATEFSFAPHRLITLFLPEYYGTHLRGNHYDAFYFWSCAYAGVATPVLALSLFRPGVRPLAAVPLLALALLGLFLAWGRGNPVYAMIMQLPGFGHFRAPAKYLPYYLTPVCVLAALGIERLSGEAYARLEKKGSTLQTNGGWIVALAVLLTFFVLLGAPSLQEAYDRLRETDGAMTGEIRLYAWVIGLILLLASITVWGVARLVPRAPRMAIALGLSLVLGVDLFTYGRDYFTATLAKPQWIRAASQTPPAVRFVQSQGDYRPIDRGASLEDIAYPNRFMLWDMPNLAGYDPMSLRSYNGWISGLESWEAGEYHDNIQLTRVDHPVLDALNVRYIFTREAIEHDHIEPVFQGQRLRVYERTRENRAWVTVTGADQPVGPESEPVWRAFQGELEVAAYEPHFIAVQLAMAQDAWVRFAEWHYPGWHASIAEAGGDAQPVEIQPTLGGMRALLLDAGEWRIEMRYESPWFRWVVTVLAWLWFLAFGGVAWLVTTGRFLPFLQRLMGRYY